MADGRHLEKSKNCSISAIDCLILMKFGTVIQLSSPDPISQCNFKILKSKMADSHHFENEKLLNALSVVTSGKRHYSRTDRRIFKLGGGVDQKVNVKGHISNVSKTG